MKTVAVYGSLKNNKYNNYILEGCKMIGIVKVVGTLYEVSSYPALLDEGRSEYDAEVYEIPDDVYERIARMEIGSGYVEVDRAVLIDHVAVKVIVYYAGEELSSFCKEYKKEILRY